MRLPPGYSVDKKDSTRLLFENTPVYRPLAKKGDVPILVSETRNVASFGKDSRVRDIEKVARLDFKSREARGVEREMALVDLSEIFRTNGKEDG